MSTPQNIFSKMSSYTRVDVCPLIHEWTCTYTRCPLVYERTFSRKYLVEWTAEAEVIIYQSQGELICRPSDASARGLDDSQHIPGTATARATRHLGNTQRQATAPSAPLPLPPSSGFVLLCHDSISYSLLACKCIWSVGLSPCR